MVDVADGWFWTDAGAGASFHRARERAGSCLWLEALFRRDAAALRRAGSPPRRTRIRRRLAVGRRLCHSRLGLAAPPAQGIAFRFPQRQPLVRRTDGAARRQARHGSQTGLRLLLAPLLRGEGWGEGLPPHQVVERIVPPHPDCFAIRPLPASGAR